jgi:hypothetical protein
MDCSRRSSSSVPFNGKGVTLENNQSDPFAQWQFFLLLFLCTKENLFGERCCGTWWLCHSCCSLSPKLQSTLVQSLRAPSCHCMICLGSQKWRMLPTVFIFESCCYDSIQSLLRTSVATKILGQNRFFCLGNYALWYWHLCSLIYCGNGSFCSVHYCFFYRNQFLDHLSLTLLHPIVSTFFPLIQSDG